MFCIEGLYSEHKIPSEDFPEKGNQVRKSTGNYGI